MQELQRRAGNWILSGNIKRTLISQTLAVRVSSNEVKGWGNGGIILLCWAYIFSWATLSVYIPISNHWKRIGNEFNSWDELATENKFNSWDELFVAKLGKALGFGNIGRQCQWERCWPWCIPLLVPVGLCVRSSDIQFSCSILQVFWREISTKANLTLVNLKTTWEQDMLMCLRNSLCFLTSFQTLCSSS